MKKEKTIKERIIQIQTLLTPQEIQIGVANQELLELELRILILMRDNEIRIEWLEERKLDKGL